MTRSSRCALRWRRSRVSRHAGRIHHLPACLRVCRVYWRPLPRSGGVKVEIVDHMAIVRGFGAGARSRLKSFSLGHFRHLPQWVPQTGRYVAVTEKCGLARVSGRGDSVRGPGREAGAGCGAGSGCGGGGRRGGLTAVSWESVEGPRRSPPGSDVHSRPTEGMWGDRHLGDYTSPGLHVA